jgi:hypothetical protein
MKVSRDIMNTQPQLPKGHTSILSPTFKYVSAAKTDLGKTFARIRKQRLGKVATGASVSVLKPKVSR